MTTPSGEVARWDERYASTDYFYGTEPNDFLRSQAHRLKRGSRVLCLAEGEGRNAVFLARQGCDVTAMDHSAVGLRKAAALAAAAGVSIRTLVADLETYPIEEGAWDGIVSIWCHMASKLRVRVHHAIVRGLAPGGVFLLESYTPEQLRHATGGPRDPDLMPTLAILRSELAGLVFDVGQELEREVHEGRGHNGTSAVVHIAGHRA